MLIEEDLHSTDSLGNDSLHQGEKQIFLAAEVRVEGTTSESGAGCDVLEAGSLESITCEDVLGSIEEFCAGGSGALLLA